jgi:hypothetical protein
MSAVLCSRCAAPLSIEQVAGRQPCSFCGAVNAPERSQAAVVDRGTPMRCASCGEENHGMKFCRRCGSVLGAAASAPLAPQEIRCAQCGRSNAAHYEFCLGCGGGLRGSVARAVPQQAIAASTGNTAWLIPLIVVLAIGIIGAAVAVFALI